MAILSALTWLALSSAVLAAPSLEPRQTIGTLTPSEIAAFAPFTHYAAATGCGPVSTLAWDCGAHCQANPTFEPVASGGDGGLVQFWYVGFDPTVNTVIVAYQGTNVSNIDAILTDLNIVLEGLDPVLFPSISPTVQTHAGFTNAHARSAKQVLAAVNTAISKFGASHVTIVGHSLGAALALLDSVYLPLHLPSSIVFKTVGYGMPMVGNQAFADYVDAHVSDVSRVNNKKDPVPILPGHSYGYQHASGEIHISENDSWEVCPGQDNTNDLCTAGDVPNLAEGDLTDHGGPYGGIEMECSEVMTEREG